MHIYAAVILFNITYKRNHGRNFYCTVSIFNLIQYISPIILIILLLKVLKAGLFFTSGLFSQWGITTFTQEKDLNTSILQNSWAFKKKKEQELYSRCF